MTPEETAERIAKQMDHIKYHCVSCGNNVELEQVYYFGPELDVICKKCAREDG